MNTKILKKALFAWMLFFFGMSSFFLSCWRDNPVDAKSGKYIPGSRPHVRFVDRSISAFLFDSVTFKIIWSDTAVGGVKGAIKKYYFSWNSDTIFNDSMDGTALDTFIFSKKFPPGTFTVHLKAIDFDDEYSDIDSMNLTVFVSKPRIDSINAPPVIEKSALCTLSVSASDSGGTIRSFLWAKDGIDFADTTALGTFYVSFKDTGEQVVLVKVRDNKSVESAIDTFHIGVYEKFYSTVYDGNGNTGGAVPTDINKYASGQSVAVIGNSGSLVKTGFAFTGWNTMANGGGASYTAGSTFSMDTANVTLYAQWTTNPTYTVAYNGNGNTGGNAPADNNQYTLGQSVTVLGNGSLVKAGNTFVGWNTQANGTGISYATGVEFTMGSISVTLYARWTANPTYTVTYNGNGNSGGTTPANNNNYIAGAMVTVLSNTGNLVKTGFTFVGWNTQSNGSGTSYATGAAFTMGSVNVNLFAQWTANPTYTLAYNGNGSISGTVPKDNNNYLTGATVTVLGNSGSLVKTGYTFTGWDTIAAGNGTHYPVGAIFTIASANEILYAQWTIIPTYIVTYNANGATGGNAPTDNNHYTLGQSVTVLGNTGPLVKTGNTFVGWNTQANGLGISYATGVAFSMGSSNVTLFAQWSANPTYTVTYNGNSNSGGTAPADNNNYTTGATITVLGNTGTLVKSGFTFVGWNTQSNGSGTSYATGVTFTMGSVNVNLFAQWTANPTYIVTYNGNGNSTGAAPSDNNNYLAGATVTILGNTGSLVKTGYTFTGWDTIAAGNGTHYAVGATFIMAGANETLYAQWTIIPTYTVTYNANGATGGNAPADNNHYTLGQSVTVLGNMGSLVKSGNTFVGWNTQANGLGISYATGVAFSMGSSNVTLFAQWSANPTYTVTYNGNGNSGGTIPVDINNYLTAAMVTVLGNTGVPVKTGSTFVSWNTQSNGSGTSYAIGATFAMGSSNVNLFAKWTANPTYTVTYNGNGNSTGAAPADNNNYLAGATVTVLGNTGSLAKTGYTFAGWDTIASGNGSHFAVGATFTIGSANDTLYAQWTLIPTYTVTYNGNGATGGNAPADNNHYTFGQSVTVLGNSGSLTKTSNTFIGWNTQANGGGISYATGVAFTMGSANVTLYAQWSANPTYIVTYYGNNNSSGAAPADNNNYLAGATVTVLSNTGSMVKTGYTFVGWNTQSNGGGTSYAAGATFAMGSSNVNLFAKWTANPTYTISYNGNGNSTGAAPADNNNYLAGATVTVLGNTGSLAKTGYTFAGWDTIASGNGSHFTVGATFTIGSANDTLYAQWTLIPTYTVTYNGNGATGNAPADNNHYVLGQSVTVLGIGSMAKTSFTFTGWNTQALGGGISYSPTVTFSMGPSNVTLYAQWSANPTFTVTYFGNGNSGGTAPADNNNYLAGANVTVLSNTGNLVKTGSTFMGWNTQANGNGTPYAISATFAMGSSNVNLFAQWTSNPTFTVTYNANGGGGTVPKDNNSYLTGATVTVLGNTGPLVKTGYSFTGWDTIASGNGNKFPVGSTFIIASKNVNLYAQWTIIPTFTVTYNANGITTGSVPTDTAHYAQGQNDTIRANTGSLVNTGFTFIGWNTQANGLGINYTPGVIIPMGTSNLVLYARWTANPTFTIFTSPGANGSISPSGNVTVMSGANQSFTIAPDSNNLIAYHISNVVVDGSLVGVVAAYTFTNITASHTIAASFAINSYTITFNKNDAGATGSMIAQKIASGSSANLTTNGFSKAGWSFTGWATTPTGSVAYTDGASYTMGTAIVTLYAKWSANSYTSTFDKNDAGATGSMTAQTIASGSSANLTTNGFSKAGWSFTGWATTPTGSVAYTDGASYTMGTANVTLYAKWSANSYTITFDKNDAGVTGSMTAQTIASGSSANLTTNGFSKTGWSFTGWATSPTGSVVYTDGASYTMGTSNVDLYAKWTANPYTITFHANDAGAGGTMAPQSIASGSTAALSANGFTKTGWAFAGWATTSGGTVAYSDGQNYTMGTSNVDLYAIWTANSYTVTFDKNDADASGTMSDQTIASGSSAPLTMNVFSKAGWTFAGWATTSGGAVAYSDGQNYTMGAANVTLFAQWTTP